RSVERAVPDHLKFSVPVRGRQPQLHLDVGVGGRLERHRDAAERGQVAELRHRAGVDGLRGGHRGAWQRRRRELVAGEGGGENKNYHVYTRSILDPMRQRISYGMVPICAAISRTSMRSAPCGPMITTSSPGDTSRPVTSAISISMQTEPTTGARRPRIRIDPRPASRRASPSAYPAGTIAIVVGCRAWNFTP